MGKAKIHTTLYNPNWSPNCGQRLQFFPNRILFARINNIELWRDKFCTILPMKCVMVNVHNTHKRGRGQTGGGIRWKMLINIVETNNSYFKPNEPLNQYRRHRLGQKSLNWDGSLSTYGGMTLWIKWMCLMLVTYLNYSHIFDWCMVGL